jgi:hypothetical protein
MKDWQDEMWEAWEKTAKDFSDWVEEVADEIVYTVDYVIEQVDIYIPREVEDFLGDLFEPLIEIENEWRGDDWDNYSQDDYVDFSEFSWNPKIEPTAEFHPACRGCANYHGRVYNGNILICGMHPYGWEEENCPDWMEKV